MCAAVLPRARSIKDRCVLRLRQGSGGASPCCVASCSLTESRGEAGRVERDSHCLEALADRAQAEVNISLNIRAGLRSRAPVQWWPWALTAAAAGRRAGGQHVGLHWRMGR